MITQMNQTAGWSEFFATSIHAGKRLALTALLCATALTGTLLAQEARPPEQSPPQSEQQAGEQPISDKETPPPANGLLQVVEPSPQASQVVDGDIIFTSPGQFTYARDIRLSDNFGGLRFIGADSLTTTPAGAAIQFFGNNASPFNGQLYLDSGATSGAALIFRTAQTGETITERMRVTSNGNVAIGFSGSGFARLHVTTGFGGNNSPLHAVAGGHNGTSVNSVGVYGSSNSGTGVEGNSFNRFGVAGFTTNGTGVYGDNNNSNTTGHAGFFNGRVTITGNLSKGGGSFKIDHPLDPANRYLSHSFVESPDMMNIYNGNVTTDAKGRAVVMLPAYFTALNNDYRYQLTVIGKFAQAIVASEIKDNRFIIKSNKPQVKVSWQVTGVRQDAYANAHRIKIEEEKTGDERGTYLHPEAFGQPATKGVKHVRHPEPRQETRAPTKQMVVATKQ